MSVGAIIPDHGVLFTHSVSPKSMSKLGGIICARMMREVCLGCERQECGPAQKKLSLRGSVVSD